VCKYSSHSAAVSPSAPGTYWAMGTYSRGA
jgi:hypothetical protein